MGTSINDKAVFGVIISIAIVSMSFFLGYIPVVMESNAHEFPTTTGIIVEHKIQNITGDGERFHDILVKVSYEVDNSTYISDDIKVERFSDYPAAVEAMNTEYAVSSAIEITYSPEYPEITINPKQEQIDSSSTITAIGIAILGSIILFSILAYYGYLKLVYIGLISLFTNTYTERKAAAIRDVVTGLEHDFASSADELLIGDPTESWVHIASQKLKATYELLYLPVFVLAVSPAMLIYTRYPDKYSAIFLLHDLKFLIVLQRLMTETLYFPVLYVIFIFVILMTDPETREEDTRTIFKIIFAIIGTGVAFLLSPFFILFYAIIAALLLIPISLPVSFVVWSILTPLVDLTGWTIRHSQVFNATAIITVVLAILIYLQIHKIRHWIITDNLELKNTSKSWMKHHSGIEHMYNHQMFLTWQNREGRLYFGNFEDWRFTQGPERYKTISLDNQYLFLLLHTNEIEVWKIAENLKDLNYLDTMPRFGANIDGIYVARDLLVALKYGTAEVTLLINRLDISVSVETEFMDEVTYETRHIDIHRTVKSVIIVLDRRIEFFRFTPDACKVIDRTELDPDYGKITCSALFGEELLIGTEKGNILVVDTADKSLAELPSNDVAITALSRNNNFLIAGQQDGSIQIIELSHDDTSVRSLILNPHRLRVQQIIIMEKDFVTCSLDGSVKVFRFDDLYLQKDTLDWLVGAAVLDELYCSICKDHLDRGEKYLKCDSCRAAFHKKEIFSWLSMGRSRNRCPVCREDINHPPRI